MSRSQLIQITLESMADWDVDIADIIEPYINKLEQESAQLKELSLKLCDAVENNDDLPPIKYALKCGYLVNKLREKAQVTK